MLDDARILQQILFPRLCYFSIVEAPLLREIDLSFQASLKSVCISKTGITSVLLPAGVEVLDLSFNFDLKSLNLGNLLNLKSLILDHSGLQRLIVPPTVTSLSFISSSDNRFVMKLKDLYSVEAICIPKSFFNKLQWMRFYDCEAVENLFAPNLKVQFDEIFVQYDEEIRVNPK